MNKDVKQLNAESDRGAHAKALLDNPLFKDAFMAINRALWTQLVKINVHETDEVKAVLLMMKANQKLYDVFAKHVQTGQMADMQLRELHARGQ